MLSLSFRLTNPFCSAMLIKDWYLRTWQLSKNKFLELQISKSRPVDLGFSFRLNFRNQDHAGLNIGLDLIWVYIGINFYDWRHWDHENNRWEEPE